MAGGQPLSEAVADQAAEWLTLLMSGEAGDGDRQRWQQWRSAHPDHERAWLHIEAVTSRLQQMVEPRAAYQALSPYAGKDSGRVPGRRKALQLLWAGMALGAGTLAWRTETARQLVADHRTATGERRTVELPDGSAITLNTASAIDVRFDAERRLVHLVRGEVLVVTALARQGRVDARPFIVQTAQGRMRALGTRFAVRQWDDGRTSVAVLESAVEIAPERAAPQLLRAGQRAVFTRDAAELAAMAADGGDTAWTRGQIVADQMRLGDFLADLARYRPGLLRCDPAVADLRLSGVFPLQDTDAILRALPEVLAVQVRRRSAYWVLVEAAR